MKKIAVLMAVVALAACVLAFVLYDQAAELKKEVTDLTAAAVEKENQIASLTAAAGEDAASIAALNEANVALSAEIETLKADIANQNDEIIALLDQVSHIATLEDVIAGKDAQLSEMTVLAIDNTNEINLLLADKTALANEIAALTDAKEHAEAVVSLYQQLLSTIADAADMEDAHALLEHFLSVNDLDDALLKELEKMTR